MSTEELENWLFWYDFQEKETGNNKQNQRKCNTREGTRNVVEEDCDRNLAYKILGFYEIEEQMRAVRLVKIDPKNNGIIYIHQCDIWLYFMSH